MSSLASALNIYIYRIFTVYSKLLSLSLFLSLSLWIDKYSNSVNRRYLFNNYLLCFMLQFHFCWFFGFFVFFTYVFLVFFFAWYFICLFFRFKYLAISCCCCCVVGKMRKIKCKYLRCLCVFLFYCFLSQYLFNSVEYIFNTANFTVYITEFWYLF